MTFLSFLPIQLNFSHPHLDGLIGKSLSLLLPELMPHLGCPKVLGSFVEALRSDCWLSLRYLLLHFSLSSGVWVLLILCYIREIGNCGKAGSPCLRETTWRWLSLREDIFKSKKVISVNSSLLCNQHCINVLFGKRAYT